MRDVATCMPFNLYNIYFNTGRVPKRSGNLLVGFSPGNLYTCTDGHVYIACNTDKQAKGVFDVIGRSELMGTEGFRSRDERWRNREAVDGIVENWTRARPKGEVFETMIAADVPCGVVQDIEEVLNDPDLNARGVFTEFDQPGVGKLRLPRSPIVFGESPAPARPGRLLGEDNERLYGEFLSITGDAFQRLVADGVTTAPPGA
jgi:formyl-CoA transferase